MKDIHRVVLHHSWLGLGDPWSRDIEVEAFARTILSYKHFGPEMQDFLYAWEGSIDFQRENASGHLALGAMSLESLQAWLTALVQTCRIPEEL